MDITYASLVTLIPAYQERYDSAFIDQIPTFINFAENRIATDMKQQGFQSVVMTSLPTNGVMQKPAWWRETISFSYTDAAGVRHPVFLRNLEYCRNYWPNSTLTDVPKFYADYNVANFLVVPTPASALDVELVYYARLQPLSEDVQTNWLTANAPQALFYACMLEANIFAKNGDAAAKWEQLYNGARSGIQAENMERTADRSEVVTRP